VYKAHFKEIQLNAEGHCGAGGLCSCFGKNVFDLQKPKMFNVNKDPQELNPIDENGDL
jgi:hypothetical protein